MKKIILIFLLSFITAFLFADNFSGKLGEASASATVSWNLEDMNIANVAFSTTPSVLTNPGSTYSIKDSKIENGNIKYSNDALLYVRWFIVSDQNQKVSMSFDGKISGVTVKAGDKTLSQSSTEIHSYTADNGIDSDFETIGIDIDIPVSSTTLANPLDLGTLTVSIVNEGGNQ